MRHFRCGGEQQGLFFSSSLFRRWWLALLWCPYLLCHPGRSVHARSGMSEKGEDGKILLYFYEEWDINFAEKGKWRGGGGRSERSGHKFSLPPREEEGGGGRHFFKKSPVPPPGLKLRWNDMSLWPSHSRIMLRPPLSAWKQKEKTMRRLRLSDQVDIGCEIENSKRPIVHLFPFGPSRSLPSMVVHIHRPAAVVYICTKHSRTALLSFLSFLTRNSHNCSSSAHLPPPPSTEQTRADRHPPPLTSFPP